MSKKRLTSKDRGELSKWIFTNLDQELDGAAVAAKAMAMFGVEMSKSAASRFMNERGVVPAKKERTKLPSRKELAARVKELEAQLAVTHA